MPAIEFGCVFRCETVQAVEIACVRQSDRYVAWCKGPHLHWYLGFIYEKVPARRTVEQMNSIRACPNFHLVSHPINHLLGSGLITKLC